MANQIFAKTAGFRSAGHICNWQMHIISSQQAASHFQQAAPHYRQAAPRQLHTTSWQVHYTYISLYCFLLAIHISLFHPITIIFYSTFLSLSNHNNLRLKIQYVRYNLQLSSKVTFARVSDTSRSCFVCTPVWQKGAWHSCTSCCSFSARFCACTDASCMHPRCVLHAFQMCSNVTMELSCTVATGLVNRFIDKEIHVKAY